MLTLPPLELAGRLALAVGLAVFMGLAFEETYKTEERSSPGGIRTFPMLAMCGATLYLIKPAHAIAFVAGLVALGAWLHAAHAVRGLAGGGDRLHAVLSELSAAALRAD